LAEVLRVRWKLAASDRHHNRVPNMASQERRLELSRAINGLSSAILRGGSTPEVLRSVVEIVGSTLRVDRALIYDVQLAKQQAVGLCEWLRPDRDIAPTNAVYPLQLFANAAREIARTGAPLVSHRAAPHPALVLDGADKLVHGQMSIQRLLWHPFLQRPDGFYLLVLNHVVEDRELSREELDFVESAAAQASLAIMKLDLLRERERTEAELRLSERRARLLYDQTPSMFFTVDRSGVVRDVNRFALEHLGYSAAELLGESVLRVVDPRDHAEVTRHLADCFADPGTVRVISFRKVLKNGSIIWVKEVTRVAESPDGAHALVVCDDITESRANEEAARQAKSKLDDKDEFLAMLGHELRNPLAPIVTALEILRGRGQADREVEVIERQVSHLCRLVDDLLDVSRITRGKVELQRKRVELATVAAQAAEVAHPLFRQKRQALRLAVAPDGLMVDADPDRMIQVFANLLNNASKYSKEEQEVVFSAERDGDRIVARVRDQGEGIEPRMLAKVFDLFVQRNPAADRAESGLGLGLSIVRSLVALHGGTVRIHSTGPGHGTEVVVDLPSAAADRPAAAARAATDRAGAPRGARAESILVVDDNEDLRTSLCRLLTLHGYQVVAAGDGPGALRLAGALRPKVIVVDIGLPGMDGYELARRLRLELPATRMVAVTGYGQASDRTRSRAAGFDAHLVKPVSFDMLRPFLDGPSVPVEAGTAS